MNSFLDNIELETLQKVVEGGAPVPPTTPVVEEVNENKSTLDTIEIEEPKTETVSEPQGSVTLEHVKNVLANVTTMTMAKVNNVIEPFTNWLEKDDYTFSDMVSAYNPFDDDNGKTKEELRPYTKMAVDSWAEQEKNLEQFYLENPDIGFMEKFVVGAGANMFVGTILAPGGMMNTFNFIKGHSFVQSLTTQAGMNMGDALYENYLQHAFGDEDFSSKVTTGKVATDVGLAGIMPLAISGSIYGAKKAMPKVISKFPNIVNSVRRKTIDGGYIESDKSTRDMINDAVSGRMGNKDEFKINC